MGQPIRKCLKGEGSEEGLTRSQQGPFAKLIFSRHGESEWNVANRFTGVGHHYGDLLRSRGTRSNCIMVQVILSAMWPESIDVYGCWKKPFRSHWRLVARYCCVKRALTTCFDVRRSRAQCCPDRLASLISDGHPCARGCNKSRWRELPFAAPWNIFTHHSHVAFLQRVMREAAKIHAQFMSGSAMSIDDPCILGEIAVVLRDFTQRSNFVTSIEWSRNRSACALDTCNLGDRIYLNWRNRVDALRLLRNKLEACGAAPQDVWEVLDLTPAQVDYVASLHKPTVKGVPPFSSQFLELGTSYKENRLVFDVGSAGGIDTAFYLSGGFRVVAIDAHPSAVSIVKKRFGKHIAAGRLSVEHGAITGEKSAKEVYVRLSGTHTKLDHVGANPKLEKRSVSAFTCSRLVARHGEPYYVKVDVEGAPCIEDLLRHRIRPLYLSLEHPGDEVICLLGSAGYTRFKVVRQGSYLRHNMEYLIRAGYFASDSGSGPFGDDAGDLVSGLAWRTLADVRRTFRGLNNTFLQLLLHGNKNETAEMKALHAEWFDLHAAL